MFKANELFGGKDLQLLKPDLPVLLHLGGDVGRQLVEVVGCLAVAVKRLLHRDEGEVVIGEVPDMSKGFELASLHSTHVQLDLRQKRPLEIGDGDGFRCVDEKAFDDSAFQMDDKRCFKMGFLNVNYTNNLFGES